MLAEFQRIFDRHIPTVLLIAALCAAIWYMKRYLRLRRMLADCRKLTAHYNGTLTLLHPLCIHAVCPYRNATIRMKFQKETVDVRFILLKPKTTIQVLDKNTLKFIRYRRGIGLQGTNKIIGASYHVMGAKGYDNGASIQKRNIDFVTPDGARKLILFTADPSIIEVYDDVRHNYDTIGDGELVYGYHIGGYSFIRKWMERNI